MTFNPDTLIKRTKGRMVMLYAVTDGNEDHMASFFHEEKVNFVVAALRAKHKNLKFVDEDAKSSDTKPVKSAKKSTGTKSTTAKKKVSALKPGKRKVR